MKSLREVISDFLKEQRAASLKEIYSGIKDNYIFHTLTPDCSVRRTLNVNDEFIRLARGVYALKGTSSTSLLVEGDGRTGLSIFEDNSVDSIICDHPYVNSKSHVGGNRNFADYEGFEYTQEDFNEKARVLKEGSFLIEFLPVENENNWEYLSNIKRMAHNAGFRYYATVEWDKGNGMIANTGRVSKSVEMITIWSLGTPRRLSQRGLAYCTRNMLKYRLDFPITRKEKVHKAMKPISLYKYLLEQFTEENELCVDSFCGSANFLEACRQTNRFAVGFEICKEYVKKAVERFNAIPLYINDEPINSSFNISSTGQLEITF